MSEKLVDWMNPVEREAAMAAKWAEKAEEVKRLTAEVAGLKEELIKTCDENKCDACAGTGKVSNDNLCMCGGSGKMSDAAHYLREELVKACEERDSLLDVLRINGFVPCDIPACNCGSWHARYGFPERWDEIKDALTEAGHPLCNENGHLVLKALTGLIEERDRYKADSGEAMKDDCYVWCVDCGIRLSKEEVKGWGCPKCGSQGVPCDPQSDVSVDINWHELRILAIWAENWAHREKDSSEKILKTVSAITRRLHGQFPEMGPLLLSEEIAALPKQLEDAGIKTGSIETNIPRPRLLQVNGPGAVGFTKRKEKP